MARVAPLVGIDLVEVGRLRERLERHPDLRGTLFTLGEQSYCQAQAKPDQHYAARFCAKEAVVKALGIDGFDPLDIEVIEGGATVRLALHGEALQRARELGVEVTVSLSHLLDVAAAVALALPSGLRPTLPGQG
jgi:holo-[acyl-carrier protein] synthase